MTAGIVLAITHMNALAQWNTSGANIFNTNAGNVGIGTSTPLVKLQVEGGNIGQLSSGTFGASTGKWSALGEPPSLFPTGTGFYGTINNWTQQNFISGLLDNGTKKDGVIAWQDQTSTSTIAGTDLRFGFIKGFGISGANPAVFTEKMRLKATGDLSIANDLLLPDENAKIFLGSTSFATNDNFDLFIQTPQTSRLQLISGEIILNTNNINLNGTQPINISTNLITRPIEITSGSVSSGSFFSTRRSTGRYGQISAFDFNTNTDGILLEQGISESGGFYADGDYAVIWSPGDANRLLRIYDEDAMSPGSTTFEKAYIDGDGDYLKASDARRKENIKSINGALSMVNNMRGVTYNFKENNDGKSVKNGRSEKSLKHGFIAQELEAVVPSLVDTDEFGNKFVSYDGIIPILLEALKEQQSEIDALREELKSAVEAISNSKSTPSNSSGTNNKLFQNFPNPFNSSTVIKYQLDPKASKAVLYIYDFQGTQLKTFDLALNQTEFTIERNQLKPGVYLYALVVDGQQVEIKNMLLTN
ncbi:MAG: tail fiber domain-containing protein [Cyclobacteriaceae bacterium]|nr:tail fiber domain-containing protein [Cyclobacteriaceae bacterium]